MKRFDEVAATDLKPGDTIARHGYLWTVEGVEYDGIGNGTSVKPAPRHLVKVRSADPDYPITRPVSLGGIIGTVWHRLVK